MSLAGIEPAIPASERPQADALDRATTGIRTWHMPNANQNTWFGDILIRSNKMQQYAGVYLLQIYSTCFGRLSHPSSGVHKTVTAASGTGNITYLSNNLPPTWP